MGEPILNVSLDLDGTCVDWYGPFARFWRGLGHTPIPEVPTSVRWWEELGIDEKLVWEVVAEFGDEGLYRHCPLFDDAQVAIPEMFDVGAELVAATSRPAIAPVILATYAWIGDNLLPFRSVSIGPDAKLDVVADIHVDDMAHELERITEFTEVVPVLLDRPWNQDAVGYLRITWDAMPGLVQSILSALDGVPLEDRAFAVAEHVEHLAALQSA